MSQEEEEGSGHDGRLEDVTNGAGPGRGAGAAGHAAMGLKKTLRSDDPTFKSAEQLRWGGLPVTPGPSRWTRRMR